MQVKRVHSKLSLWVKVVNLPDRVFKSKINLLKVDNLATIWNAPGQRSKRS